MSPRETTLADVLADSGPLWLIPSWHPRYVIFAVSGYRIEGGSGRLGGASHVSPTWAVLDSANCWKEVGRFTSGSRGLSREQCLVKAEEFAATLNVQPSLK